MVTDRKGQAMIEAAIGMFALALVAAAIIAFSDIILTSLDMQKNLRAEAGESALASSAGTMPEYISDWDEGKDGIPYTGDDRSIGGAAIASDIGMTQFIERKDSDTVSVEDFAAENIFGTTDIKVKVRVAMPVVDCRKDD